MCDVTTTFMKNSEDLGFILGISNPEDKPKAYALKGKEV